MTERILKNKPLVEALLELKWVLPPPSNSGIDGDPHYRLLLGRFSERVQNEYPIHEPLPTAQIPDAMVPHMVQHRFRTSQSAWPLIQMGPGIVTLNETAGYTWKGFKPRCERVVSSLFDAHPAKNEFIIQEMTLRYIDAIEFDATKDNVFKFLDEKMRVKVSLPDNLFEKGHVQTHPNVFNWQASFPHNPLGGTITLRFGIGQHGGKPALVWETLVQTLKDGIPRMPGGFSEWLEKAHEITDDWFFKLIEGDLEKRFSGG